MLNKISTYEFIEYAAGLSNSLIGFSTVIYAIITLKQYKSKTVRDTIRKSCYLLLLLSLFSAFHFIREIFHLKDIYGPIAEFPEYAAIFFAYVLLILQVLRLDKIEEITEK